MVMRVIARHGAVGNRDGARCEDAAACAATRMGLPTIVATDRTVFDCQRATRQDAATNATAAVAGDRAPLDTDRAARGAHPATVTVAIATTGIALDRAV